MAEKRPFAIYSGVVKELQAGDTLPPVAIAAVSATTGFTVYAAAIGKTFLCSGTFTVAFDAAATLGSSFYCTIINTGSGSVTLDPSGTEVINGLTAFVLASGQSCDVFCDGSKFFTLGVYLGYLLARTQKAIFGYGSTNVNVSMTNLVSNTGVVATDTTGVGTARDTLAAAGYGADKAIFGYGLVAASVSLTNLVSNTGVVATDTTGVGTARQQLAASRYGTDKAIFGYGYSAATDVVSVTNKVSNLGVVATDTTGVGTARKSPAAAGYGGDKALFGYGLTTVNVSMTNLVSNTGVVATDTTGVGTARRNLAAAGYGGDKALFGYGWAGGPYLSMTNLVSNTGVVSTDTTGVGTARYGLAAAGYSLT